MRLTDVCGSTLTPSCRQNFLWRLAIAPLRKSPRQDRPPVCGLMLECVRVLIIPPPRRSGVPSEPGRLSTFSLQRLRSNLRHLIVDLVERVLGELLRRLDVRIPGTAT